MSRRPTTLWIGSMAGMPAQVLTINATPVVIPAGDYYVRHTSADLSALSAMAAAMTAAGLTGVSVTLTENLYVRIAANEIIDLTWTDPEMQRLLGFVEFGSWNGATSHLATRRSKWIWSAGWPGRLSTPSGIDGYDEEDAEIRPSADGTEQEVDHFVTQKWQEIDYDTVPRIYFMRTPTDTADGGNNWRDFRREVLLANARFRLYEQIIWDSTAGTTTPITWTTSMGPYRVREMPKLPTSRKIDLADTYWRVEAKLRVVPEYVVP